MGEARLYAGPERPEKDSGALVVRWEERDVGPGEISLPAWLDGQLVRIRSEHMAWAYETGLELGPRLECGEALSMWWTSLLYERHPKMSPQLYPVYKLRALELLLAERGCTSLRLFGGDARLAKTLAAFCRRAGIAFTRVGRSEKAGGGSLLRRLYMAAPAPARALARLAHWLVTVRRLLPFPPPPEADGAAGHGGPGGLGEPGGQGGGSALIAVYFPNIDLHAAGAGRFVSRYWESLHELLNRHAGERHFVRWLFIRFPSPGLDLRQCLALRDSFCRNGADGLSFRYLEEYLGTGDIFAAIWRWLRLCAASLGISAAGRFCLPGSGMNFWRYAREDYAESFRGWRCLERCLQNRAFRRMAKSLGPQRFILYPLENCPWERMLVSAAREQKSLADCPIIGAQHSSVRRTDFRYFDDPRTFSGPCARFQPDILAANGESALRQLLENGMPPERIARVEALRYLYLSGRVQAKANPPGLSPAQPGEPLADGPRPRLLLLSSFFGDETEALLELFARAWHAGLLARYAVTVKPHPCYPVEERLKSLLGAHFGRLRLASGPIGLELTPGTRVWAANSTTAALDAALRGLPLMVALPRGDFDLCPIQDIPGLARCATLDDVRGLLPGLAAPAVPPDYMDLDPALPAWRRLLRLEN